MPKSSRSKSKPSSKPQPQDKDPKQNLKDKVQQDQADLAKWSGVAADPSLSPQAAEVARNLARSTKLALMLGQKALLYQEPQGDQEGQPKPPPESLVPAD